MPRKILLLTLRGSAIPPKYINIIYEFCLARQRHDVWIAAVPESCSTAELIEPNCLPNLIQKFDSDAVLLSNLISEFSSARQKHNVCTGPKLTERKPATDSCLFALLRPSSDVVLLPCRTCNLIWLWHGKKITLIQTSCQSRTKFRIYWCFVTILLLTSRGNAIPSKYINIIYEFCLARQKHDIWIAAVPESCSSGRACRT